MGVKLRTFNNSNNIQYRADLRCDLRECWRLEAGLSCAASSATEYSLSTSALYGRDTPAGRQGIVGGCQEDGWRMFAT